MTRNLDLARLLSPEGLSQVRLADRSGIVLDPAGLDVFAVNDTGMCLLEAIRDGVDRHVDLVRRLMAEFEVDEATAAADVDAFVELVIRTFQADSEAT